MWRRRSHALALLSKLTAKDVPFRWKEKHQQAFEAMNRITSREILVSFPDYNQPFDICVDASDPQLGAELRQSNKILALFSKELNAAQQNYRVGEKKMLSVVESLRELRTMIYG